LNSFLDDIKGLKTFLNDKNEGNPKIIEIYVAPEWKYTIYSFAYENGIKNLMKSMMSQPEIRKNSKEAVKYIKQLIKSTSQLDIPWTYQSELSTLQEAKKYIENEISIPISIIKAENSSHLKAKVAIPRRPGINFVLG